MCYQLSSACIFLLQRTATKTTTTIRYLPISLSTDVGYSVLDCTTHCDGTRRTNGCMRSSLYKLPRQADRYRYPSRYVGGMVVFNTLGRQAGSMAVSYNPPDFFFRFIAFPLSILAIRLRICKNPFIYSKYLSVCCHQANRSESKGVGSTVVNGSAEIQSPQ